MTIVESFHTKGDILVVDDHLPSLKLLVKMLIERGYHVRGAANGHMALQSVHMAIPNLILLDINMPDMSGYDVCAKIKANPETHHVPIIFISALDAVFDKVMAFNVGGVDYITKPFQIEEVLARVENHLTIRELQQQLEMTNERLEKRVLERTAELAQTNAALREEIVERERTEQQRADLERQLYQSQKMEALGRLAGGVAHDFNNLLTVIMGHAELLLDETDIANTPAKADVEQVLQTSRRARNLTRQLLAFSRRRIVHLEAVNLNDLVLDMERMLLRLVEANIRLETNLSQKLGDIQVDRGQIEQVIMNLVINARDAMLDGGIVTIETANATRSDMPDTATVPLNVDLFVRLTVKDTGIGMDEQTIEKIFEPFFTTKGPDLGTGLGLATVQGIVQQRQGYIQVDSKVGQGTVFNLYFPQTKAIGVTPEVLLAPQSVMNGPSTVFVVEDDNDVRRVLKRLLEQQNFTVIDAKNPLEALQICKTYSHTIQLLMTDIIMPYMNGPKLAEQLRQTYPELKILYMSGYTDDLLLSQFVTNSRLNFIEKPFTREDLIKKIQQVLV